MSVARLEKIIIWLILAVVAITPIIYFKQSVFPYTLPKTAFFQGMVEIIFLLWLVLLFADRSYRPRRTPFLRTLGIFLGVLLLSGFLGADAWRSFWSIEERLVGVFVFLHMGALALVVSSLGRRLPWRTVSYVSVSTAALASALAFLQLRLPNFLLEADVAGRPGSTFGNPSFFAGYLLFNIFLGLYLAGKRSEAGHGWRDAGILWALGTAILNSAALFAAQTRADILGLGLGLFLLLLFFSYRPPQIAAPWLRHRGTYLALLFVVLVSAAGFWATRSADIWSKVPGLNRFRNLEISANDETVLPRVLALRAAWTGFKERPVLGWGWDNFNLAFNKYYNPEALRASYQETRFDKPHNFILEYMVAGGIILLLAFLALVVVFIWQAWRIKDALWAQMATAAFAAYLVHNLFIFDTLGPLLMLYLFFGYTDGAYREACQVAPSAGTVRGVRQSPLISVWLVAGSALLGMIFAYQLNVPTVLGGYYQFWGFKYFVRGQAQAAIQSFRKSVYDIWTPYSNGFGKDYATTAVNAFFYNPGLVSAEEVKDAISTMESISAAHPQDAFYHQLLVDMYNQAADLDLKNYTTAAEHHAQIALELSPNRQEILFSLAKTKSLEGDNKAAIEIAKRGMELEPLVPDGHFYYGLLAFVDGQNELGYREIKRAVELGRKWKSFYEPRVVANFFADAGHLEEAIELYKTSLTMRDEEETRIKLGIAYFYAGQTDLARKEIQTVMQKIDLTESPAWPSLSPILRELQLLPN